MLGLAALRRCSLFSPIVISTLIWLVVFTAGLFLEDRFYPIKERAFIAWLSWFMVANLIFFLLYPYNPKNSCINNKIRKIPIDYSLPLLVLIIWLGYRIWVVGNSGPEDFFLNLRMSALNPQSLSSIGSLVIRSYPLIFALFLFEHIYLHQENRHLRRLLWCYMLLYAMANMSKLSILTPMLSWVIIQGILGRLKMFKIFAVALIALTLMIFLHHIRASPSSDLSLADILSIYIYSPIIALGYMDIDESFPIGAYTLRFFYVIGNIVGIAPQPAGTIMPYVAVPELTNVYTVMQPFYYDFGLLGVLFEAMSYGLFFSFLYFLSVRKGGFWLALFSGYSIVLVMQFFADVLISQLSGNIQLLICILAVFSISRKVSYAS